MQIMRSVKDFSSLSLQGFPILTSGDLKWTLTWLRKTKSFFFSIWEVHLVQNLASFLTGDIGVTSKLSYTHMPSWLHRLYLLWKPKTLCILHTLCLRHRAMAGANMEAFRIFISSSTTVGCRKECHLSWLKEAKLKLWCKFHLQSVKSHY